MPGRSPVSILMNSDSCSPLLGDALKSAFGEEYSNVEVAAFDDGSSDDLRDAMSLFGERIVGVE
jgi:hypothetical protein